MRPHEPRNRAERRAMERAQKRADRVMRLHGQVSIGTRYVIRDAEGRDVTSERVKPRDS